MPLVEGRVTKVNVQLGDKVRAGQTLASIFSAELAEAQMKYLTVDANRQFHIDQARRFEKLAEIGAVSRQEVEEVAARLREHHAEHASLRERMLLYGLTRDEISQLTTSREVRSEVPVHAPAAGTITTRDVNIGQNLTMRDRLFTNTDLTSVWVVANVYEKDFAIMQPGRKVTITTQAWPGRSWAGRIAYIDPRIIEQTRTAQVRIEVPNLDLRLKIGMFVDVNIESGGADEALAVPKAAVQSIGDERIVFVPVGPGRFQVRRVMLGEESGDLIRVINGLTAGDQVITEGSFFLRAELGRKRNNQ
jgi:cobalt-zinc-cadmium efflux system membrane fusion protein